MDDALIKLLESIASWISNNPLTTILIIAVIIVTLYGVGKWRSKG
jgi:hypothetical protein